MNARDRLIAWLGEVHAVPQFDVGGLIRDVEAAAEERGRRAWIGDLRAIQQLAEWAVDAVAAEAGRQGGDQLGREAAHAGRINLDRLRERIAALAPRDSASATSDYPGCGDPAHDCRDGVCGAGPAPKDRK